MRQLAGAFFARLLAPIVVWALALCFAAPAAAQPVLPVPPLSARVMDQTGTLGATERQALDERLAAFEREKGAQIVILMVPTTRPEDIAAYAWRVADAWKIGRRDVGDGVLLVVAKDDRRVRIEVARTLEGAVPDLAASRIIEERIAPAFRQGDYAGGLQAAADALMALIRGERLPEPRQAGSDGAGDGLNLHLVFLALFIVPIVARILRGTLGRKLGALATGGGAGAFVWWVTASVVSAGVAGVVALLYAFLSGGIASGWGARRAGWGGGVGAGWPGGGWSGGGGGGGSGGFSSGGGGSFGGGGASGDW